MIRSMTAYGRGKLEHDRVDITVEIRSVNSRYFDCTVRLPRQYHALEDKVRTYVQKHAISRGKVEVNLTFDHHEEMTGNLSIDWGYAKSYLDALYSLRDTYGLADDISVMALAKNGDVFKKAQEDADMDEIWELLEPILASTCQSFVSMRELEGQKTIQDLKGKLEQIRLWSQEVETLSKQDNSAYKTKLETRIRAILGDMGQEVDENRLLTECAIWADKIAVDEELVRLRAHFGAFYDICEEPTPSGKKLDFLMQEMNRETNTIGSKASNAAIARLVVNMKNELEKIREQIQNLE